MNTVKLLIVDDEEDNRLVLNSICKKLESFQIEFGVNGLDAIAKTEAWQPDIILMDIMMPEMDGYEASKIIKEKYPHITIIAISAVSDVKIEENMYNAGINIYLTKPVDRSLLRYKLNSLAASIRNKKGIANSLSTKNSINPFNADIRSFKTVFDIRTPEDIMDFGIWLVDQYHGKSVKIEQRYDKALELLYKLMVQGCRNYEELTLIVEESHNEYYISLQFNAPVILEPKLARLIQEFGENSLLEDEVFSLRLKKAEEKVEKSAPEVIVEQIEEVNTQEIEEVSVSQETRILNSSEEEILRKSFVNKTSAVDYINELGGDVIEEIMELASVDEEWQSQLITIESEKTVESLQFFTNSVLASYIGVVNNLFEFTGVAYALSTLSLFLNGKAEEISSDEEKIKTLVMLLEHLGEDLRSWKKHIFETQSTDDIHYLDSSLFNSCMQIESIVTEQAITTEEDDDIEFF